MSNPRLPVELLDHVADYLHGRKEALRNCCLVSKSWIPRARKHLFADIRFNTRAVQESWKEMFPDPSISPAHYTKTLLIDCSHIVTAADAEARSWIRGFSCVVHLRVYIRGLYSYESVAPLVPLHGFSPIVKSLRMEAIALPSSQMFDFILSFPLLEDLAVINSVSYGSPTPIHPSNPPKFTGSLELMMAVMGSIARQFLSLPGGLHFRKLVLMWTCEEHVPLTSALVERCSHTLESLDITCYAFVVSVAVDLSKATKLQDVIFRSTSSSVKWITADFQTTIPEHRGLRKITIDVPRPTYPKAATIPQSLYYGPEWLDLERLLVRFLESRSTCLKVVRIVSEGPGRDMRGVH